MRWKSVGAAEYLAIPQDGVDVMGVIVAPSIQGGIMVSEVFAAS